MIVEVRTVQKHSTAVKIRELQYKGKIKRIITKDGYVAYDSEELEEYNKHKRNGRPIKIKPTDTYQ